MEVGDEGSGVKRRTAVSGSPLASAKTTRFLGPALDSLRMQLRRTEGEGDDGSNEEEEEEVEE